ncbi:MAG: hypothetical protein JWL64_410, partial [Frankiales bacterium]|nr:hypothetical protein [Frankiales bacterium]
MSTVLALLLLSGCAGGAAPGAHPRFPALPTAPAGLPVVDVRVGTVVLRAEVADTEPLREAGLRGRAEVPRGTGMVFRFDGPARQRFTMAGVS